LRLPRIRRAGISHRRHLGVETDGTQVLLDVESPSQWRAKTIRPGGDQRGIREELDKAGPQAMCNLYPSVRTGRSPTFANGDQSDATTCRRAGRPAFTSRRCCNSRFAASKRHNAACRGLGTIAFLAACRYAMLVGRDPAAPDRRVLAPIRSNLAKLPPSLAFRITAADGSLPTVEWLGLSARSANSLLVGPVHAQGSVLARAVASPPDPHHSPASETALPASQQTPSAARERGSTGAVGLD
jgi:hypothetical protein